MPRAGKSPNACEKDVLPVCNTDGTSAMKISPFACQNQLLVVEGITDPCHQMAFCRTNRAKGKKKKEKKMEAREKKKAKAQDSVAMLFLVSGGAVYADVTQNRICRIGANISLLFPCPQAR